MTSHPSAPLQHRGHTPVLSARTGAMPEPIDAAVIERFRTAPVADVSDAVGRLYTAASRLHPLYSPMPRVIGTALTVKAIPGDNWAIHGALRLAGPGSVLVIDWRGETEACAAGASVLLPAIERGLAGVVVDGTWRDVEEVRALGFPIAGIGVSAASPAKERPGEINVPVACGDVVVHPGDLVIADHEGTVFVPRGDLEAVARHLDLHFSTSVDEDLARSEFDRHQGLGDEYWAAFGLDGGLPR